MPNCPLEMLCRDYFRRVRELEALRVSEAAHVAEIAELRQQCEASYPSQGVARYRPAAAQAGVVSDPTPAAAARHQRDTRDLQRRLRFAESELSSVRHSIATETARTAPMRTILDGLSVSDRALIVARFERGRHQSLEQLAEALDVSGATVDRRLSALRKSIPREEARLRRTLHVTAY